MPLFLLPSWPDDKEHFNSPNQLFGISASTLMGTGSSADQLDVQKLVLCMNPLFIGLAAKPFAFLFGDGCLSGRILLKIRADH